MDMLNKRLIQVVRLSVDNNISCLVTNIIGEESISACYEYKVKILVDNIYAINSRQLLGTIFCCKINHRLEKSGYINGIITNTKVKLGGGGNNLELVVSPWLSLLKYNKNCRIFQNKTIPQIATTIFKENGFSDYDISGLKKVYDSHDYLVQYNESDLDFVRRILANAGIYFYFEQQVNQNLLCLADSIYQTPLIKNIAYSTDPTLTQPHIYKWINSSQHSIRNVKYADYNPNQAAETISVQADSSMGYAQHVLSKLEYYSFPSKYKTKEEGYQQAQFYANHQAGLNNYVKAESNCDFLHAGTRIALQDDPYESFLITKLELDIYDFSDTTKNISPIKKVHNSFSAQSTAINYSPKQLPKPRIDGAHTAVVVGPKQNEIYTDAMGRVKVQFHWDRFGGHDQNSSCWIRVSQSQAGNNWGGFYIPRVGDEVLVVFINDDIDRPIILGSLYNSSNMPPYDLPEEKEISGIKTPGHELSFNDKSNEEEIFFHTQKDYDEYINNDSRRIVRGNHHKIIESGDHHIQVENGSGEISAAKKLNFTSNNSSLTIKPDGILISAPVINLNPNSSGAGASSDKLNATTYDEDYDSLDILGIVPTEENNLINGIVTDNADVNASSNLLRNLTISYNLQQENDLKPLADTYYKVTFADGSSKTGQLNQDGYAHFNNVPSGIANVSYGLTKEDAETNTKEEIYKEHQQLVANFKSALNEIISKTDKKAQIQKEKLKQHNMFGRGWVYTDYFFKGLAEGRWDILKQVFGLFKLVGHTYAEDTQQSALFMQGLLGNNPAAIQQYKAQIDHEALGIRSDVKTIKTLYHLMQDPDIRNMLYSFPIKYFHADSGQDEAEMLGKFAPSLIVAVITVGGSVSVAGSKISARIAELIGGAKGTVARLLRFKKDNGEIVQVDNEIDSIASDSEISDPATEVLTMEPIKVKCFPAYQSEGYKRLSSESERVVYIHEYKTQLKNQQDAINEMDVATMRRNIGNLGDGKLVRADKLVQNEFRMRAKRKIKDKTSKTLDIDPNYLITKIELLYPRDQYLSMSDKDYNKFIFNKRKKLIEKEAILRMNKELDDKDVLHNPDKIAGGLRDDMRITKSKFKMGSSSINRSIGRNWQLGRAKDLRQAISDISPNVQMKVELKICPP